MPVTQVLNSKANVKKNTNSDLPFSPQQPVISSFYAVSTAGQTVINLSFSVDSVNLSDQFFLFVDGKKLRLGASNDYTFTSVSSTGLSSQVTLNQALAVNLNIQAYVLGLKKESEFNMDNRFVQLYEAQNSGFQGFVSQTSFINTATTTTGTPAAGTFYSPIINRASMVDLSQDLKPRMAIDRMPTQSAYLMQGEFGASGESVFAVTNDLFGQIRFVGNWANIQNTNGQGVFSAVTNDFVEIVFCGTGINVMLVGLDASRDIRASVDGGSEGGNLITGSATMSTVMQTRNYSPNIILPVNSGLTYGVHTVKLRLNASVTTTVQGFEILNESSSVKINPGVSYTQGKKYTSSALQSFLYTAPVTGTRGGRAVVYQNGDGTISTAWQAVNASQANLSSADHTNEEIIRRYYIREFGAGRADDFSLLSTSGSDRVFLLDDGSTNLYGKNIRVVTGETFNPGSPGTDFMTLHFIGTGLDIIRKDDGNSGTNHSYTVSVDGSSIGTVSNPASTNTRVEKLVSGLTYGSHTVKILNSTSPVQNIGFQGFITYGPKKPSIPSGVVELADYNVLATFVASTTSGADTISTGVMRKSQSREMTYSGTWTDAGLSTNDVTGREFVSNTNGDFIQYTFFGTGFDFRHTTGGGATDTFTMTLDGSTSIPGTTSSYGSGQTFTAGTGLISTPLSSVGYGVTVSGLTLGIHTVKIAKTSGAANWAPQAFDIITPIHSAKSNIYTDLENSLPIGSQGLSDNRKITPIKDTQAQLKNYSQAIGITSNPTTTSTIAVPVPEMSCVIKVASNKITVSYSIAARNSTVGVDTTFQIYIDSVAVGVAKNFGTSVANVPWVATDRQVFSVSPGTHKVDVYAFVNSNTTTFATTNRNMLVEET